MSNLDNTAIVSLQKYFYSYLAFLQGTKCRFLSFDRPPSTPPPQSYPIYPSENSSIEHHTLYFPLLILTHPLSGDIYKLTSTCIYHQVMMICRKFGEHRRNVRVINYDAHNHILSWITWLVNHFLLTLLGLRCLTISGVEDVEFILEWVCV